MSQFPPPGQPSQPAYAMQPTRSNGWGLAALITGIIGFCSFGFGGLLALIFGIVGIRKSKVTHTGGGMSMAGLIIGLLSLVGWGIAYGLGGMALIFGIGTIKASAPMRAANDQFIHDLSSGSLSSASADTDGSIPDSQLQSLVDDVKDLGAVKDVTSIPLHTTADATDLTGSATFDKGSRTFSVHVVKKGDAWKIASFSFNESSLTSSPSSEPTTNP